MSDSLRLQTNQADFHVIRTQGYVYVDKTQSIVDMFDKDNKVFMSRPRRFGKSLMLSTIENIFLGRTELFKGLAIEEHLKEPFFQKHPVLCLDMSRASAARVDLVEEKLMEVLKLRAEDFRLEITAKNADSAFSGLIERIAKREGTVVILIDEYDIPLVDNYDNPELQNLIRKFFRNFYYQIKNSEKYIHAVYITGISKYAKMGVFSAANNIRDLSTNEDLRTMFGYTHEEIVINFEQHINNMAERMHMTTEDLLEKMKSYYDGYAFSANDEPTVYNPTSIHYFFAEKRFGKFWIETGDQQFIENYIAQANLTVADFEHYKITLDQLRMPGEIVKSIAPALFLYQAGYLTLRKEVGVDDDDDDEIGIDDEVQLDTDDGVDAVKDYYLTYPNIEVLSAMITKTKHNFFTAAEWSREKKNLCKCLRKCLKSENYVGLLSVFNTLFFDVPFDDYDAAAKDPYHLECFYRNNVYMLMYFTHLDVRPEEHKAFGAVDLALYYGGKRICFELKVAQTGTGRNLQTKLRRAHEQMCKYVGPNGSAIPICCVISGRLRRIALASVGQDVYACAPDAKGSEAAEFVRIGDLEAFLASPWESPAMSDDAACGAAGQSAPQDVP